MLVLALSDSWAVFLAAFQLVFSAVVSVSLWRLTAWQRKYEGLEGKLHDATSRLIDERFRSMTQEVDRHVRSFIVAIDDVRERLLAGDSEVRTLAESATSRIELSLVARIDLLKDYIRETTVSKGDLDKHESAAERRLASLEARLAQLNQLLGKLAERA